MGQDGRLHKSAARERPLLAASAGGEPRLIGASIQTSAFVA